MSRNKQYCLFLDIQPDNKSILTLLNFLYTAFSIVMLGLAVTHRFRPFFGSCVRNASFFRLPKRELIGLRGPTSPEFLQGLMTNDIRLLEKANSLMYALFLNVKVSENDNCRKFQSFFCNMYCVTVML